MSYAAVMIGTDTLSAMKTKTNTFANNVEPDETAHYELSNVSLHCLPSVLDLQLSPFGSNGCVQM